MPQNLNRWQRVAIAVALTFAVIMPAMLQLDGGTNPARAQTNPPQAFAPRDEDPKNFPEGPGRDETFYSCTACHAFKLVTQQGMTRDQWDESLSWMTQRHKMPEITGKDREVILAYLSTHYAPKAQAGARGWKNPFAPQ